MALTVEKSRAILDDTIGSQQKHMQAMIRIHRLVDRYGAGRLHPGASMAEWLTEARRVAAIVSEADIRIPKFWMSPKFFDFVCYVIEQGKLKSPEQPPPEYRNKRGYMIIGKCHFRPNPYMNWNNRAPFKVVTYDEMQQKGPPGPVILTG